MCLPQQSHKGGTTIPKLQKKKEKEKRRIRLKDWFDLVAHGLQPIRLLCPWGFFRQDYWSGSPFPSPRDLPNPGIEPKSPASQTDALPSEPPGKSKHLTVDLYSIKMGPSSGCMCTGYISLFQRSIHERTLRILEIIIPQLFNIKTLF